MRAGRRGAARPLISPRGPEWTLYAGTVVGGELCYELDGSTDMAPWHPLADVPALVRVPLVDIGLAAAGLS